MHYFINLLFFSLDQYLWVNLALRAPLGFDVILGLLPSVELVVLAFQLSVCWGLKAEDLGVEGQGCSKQLLTLHIVRHHEGLVHEVTQLFLLLRLVEVLGHLVQDPVRFVGVG